MRGKVLRFVVGLAVLGATVMGVVAGTGGSLPGPGAVDSAGSSFVAAGAPVTGYDAVETRIDLQRDGDARWQVTFRYELTDAAAREAFSRARANVSNPPGVFVTRMGRAVGRAEDATGRSMAVQNGSVRTRRSVPDGRYGLVSYRFTWTNFAATPSSDRYVLGDAVGGMRLGPNETLWMEWPDGFERASVSPAPDTEQAHAVGWTGPLRFRTEDPTVALSATGAGATGGPLVLVGGGVGLALLAALGWYTRDRWRGDSATEETTADAATEPAASGPADGTTAAGEADADEGDQPPADLLTDEERVLRLLEESGGRMKQQDLLEAVEWSRTKASDVVNEMHEDGHIEVYRLGRENVLALPGEIEV